MKCLYSPFCTSCSVISSCCTSRHSRTLSSVLISYDAKPPGWREITTSSPSLRYATRRVRSITAAASDARRYSSSPIPRMSGEPLRAPISRSGSSDDTTARPKAPSTCVSAWRTASSSGIHCCFRTSAIRWAISSVSVSLRSSYPLRSISVRSARKFSTIPLCTTASVPSDDVCGCAFTSVGGPCVAHRVCAMPSVPRGASPLHAFARFDTLPAALTTLSVDAGLAVRGERVSGLVAPAALLDPSRDAPPPGFSAAAPAFAADSCITARPAES